MRARENARATHVLCTRALLTQNRKRWGGELPNVTAGDGGSQDRAVANRHPKQGISAPFGILATFRGSTLPL
jgi:hypothetical protein